MRNITAVFFALSVSSLSSTQSFILLNFEKYECNKPTDKGLNIHALNKKSFYTILHEKSRYNI